MCKHSCDETLMWRLEVSPLRAAEPHGDEAKGDQEVKGSLVDGE